MIDFFKKIKFFSKTTSKFCPVCNSMVDGFIPIPEQFRGKVIIKDKEYLPYLQAEMLNANEYSCPKCGASDRERFYVLYLQNYFFKNKKAKDISMVHFAPEVSLKKFLSQFSFKEYRTADLMMEGVDDKIDLTDLTMYKDSHFDFFICSHMLEHILDDIKAMEELHRILKPKAKAILVVPILIGLKEIYEDDSIITEKERLVSFGQEDHVRMYSKAGYIKRLENVGFKVHEFNVHNFSNKLFKKNAIELNSVLYIVEK